MRIVIQRVRRATVTVDGREVAGIGPGLLALVGFSAQDASVSPKAVRLARRLVTMRIFDDAEGRLNRSLQDVQGELLLVPQITLTASLAKGTRPSFHTAATPEIARPLFDALIEELRAIYPRVSIGEFQARMVVSLENDGPVTFLLSDTD